MAEQKIEQALIKKLTDLKYIYREDIRDHVALEQNFRAKFENINRVHLMDNEFQRLLEQIITQDVFPAAPTLRERNNFERDGGTPLFWSTLKTGVKTHLKWPANCVSILTTAIRYDVLLLINGVQVVQIELKTLPSVCAGPCNNSLIIRMIPATDTAQSCYVFCNS
ncbi:MAG: hypothetical protein LBS77_03365 [Desulfovibrio sp.]|jgi:type I restriction enzyme R subunit|nr:hypothetical protein [Desulfovibrio sp.]